MISIQTAAAAILLQAALCTPCSILEQPSTVPDWTELREAGSQIITLEEAEEEKEVAIVEENNEPSLTSLGYFQVTAYCSCYICCGNSCGYTSSGTVPTAGRTIGVGYNSSLKAGTHVLINGHEYVVEDTGPVKSNV